MSEDTITVGEVMTREVLTASPDDLLSEVARRLVERGVSGLPVVWSDGRVVGVISEGDLLKRWQALQVPSFVSILGGMFPTGSLQFLEQQVRQIAAVKVADVMTRPAVTAAPEWSVAEAARAMMRHGVKRLPVVDPEGRLVGIVTRADLIRAMAR